MLNTPKHKLKGKKMRNTLNFNSAQRRTRTTDGITNVVMTSTGGEVDRRVTVGTLVRPSRANTYTPVTLSGQELGVFVSRNMAASCLKRHFQANGADPVPSISLEDAAKILSPNAKNPLSALKKKIARGSVKTVVVDGETRVVL